MLLKAFIEEASPQIESTLSTLIPSRPDLAYGSLSDSMRYSLLSGGKRLRPLMLLAAATTYGMDLRAALIPACALEIVHTYSLIHDDLPCMDDDDLRRGKPSLHKVVPEWEALLAGDALLTSAFEILSSLTHLEDTDALALIRVLSRAAGPNGMIGGQVLDLLAGSSDWPRVVSMHEKKTGALIAAALQCGGILAKAPLSDQDKLHKAGLEIGLAFQLVDDLLNETGCAKNLGKPTGSDRLKEKTTAVTLLGLEKTTSLSEDLLISAQEKLRSLSRPAPLLIALFETLVHRAR